MQFLNGPIVAQRFKHDEGEVRAIDTMISYFPSLWKQLIQQHRPVDRMLSIMLGNGSDAFNNAYC